MKEFKEILEEMSKPEINELKHQELLEKAINTAEEKSVISFWWIIIPLYVIAAMLMKSYFVKESSFFLGFHELTDRESYTAVLIFAVLPLIIIIVNIATLSQLYFHYPKSGLAKVLKVVLSNVILIIISLVTILFYLS